jgi:hypothetical protein
MEKIKTPIFLTTLYVFIYLMVCELDRTAQWAIMLFSLSPLPVIWMVYRVLRDGTPQPSIRLKKSFMMTITMLGLR